MAVSGSVDYTRTARQLIRSAFRLLGVTQSGENPTAAEEQDALEAFEMMVKTFQANDHLWTRSEATLFLTASTESYTMDGSSSRAVSSFGETALAGDVAVSASSFDVDSISGIADGDVIGIVTSSTTIHWTTVNGAPAGSTVTVDDAFTATASEDAAVYFYTAADDLIDRPLRIESIRRRDVSGNSAIDTPVGEMGREEYFDLPYKSNTGRPVQYYYDPGRASGTLYIWPAPDVISQLLKITYLRPIQDFDAATNDPDFPQEWLECLKYQLAVRLAPEYGVTLKPEVASIAASLLENVMGWDNEPNSIYFQPAFNGWG